MLYLFKIQTTTRFLGLLPFVLWLSTVNSSAQTPGPHVMISVVGPSEVGIQIDLGTPSNSWSFRNAYAGTLDLGKRIENVQARPQ
jgi:hypothetical protein